MRLDGSTFIITGGGSGLGRASVRRLHASGARVLIADANVELGQSLAAELGERALFSRTDVTSEADAHAAIGAACECFGALDGLINCAGSGEMPAAAGESTGHDLDLFSRILAVNIIGTFNMIRMAAAVMASPRANGRSRRRVIVNTATPALLDGCVGGAGYAAARGAVVGMTLPLARELADSGIRVVTIAPARSHVVTESAAGKSPFLQCLGTPEEYASLVQHVIENEALSGESIPLDGFSQREVEVLHLVAQGKTNKEIGMILGISARTAQVHISHIYAKIGVGNRAGAMLWLSERQTLLRRCNSPLMTPAAEADGLPRYSLEYSVV
jgi:NAD(P)-dependent dehydrogenase (short-subunit alcohol dehydrogenase family)